MNPQCDQGSMAKREKQVNAEFTRAEEACGRLVTEVEKLEEQLHSVLQETVPPINTKGEAKAAETLVPFAHRIKEHSEILQQLGYRIGNLFDRLEIR